jgi:hypothetical protein
MIKIAKIVTGEFANKFTTPKEIAYNGKMTTNNMIKSKSSEYPCFRISATLTPKSLTESMID